jgi:hypothetical protein
MSCNCKKENNQAQNNEETNIITTIFKYFLNFFIFAISLMFSPVALVGYVIVMFRVIVLNKNVDILSLTTNFISNYRKYKEIKSLEDSDDEDDDYDYSELEVDADDYEMVDVEVITKETK